MVDEPGTAVVGTSLQVGVSILGQALKPHFGHLAVPIAAVTIAGRFIHRGQGPLTVPAVTLAEQGHRIRRPYDPGLLRLMKVIGGAVIGSSLKVGVSRIGQTYEDMAEVREVSSIELVDGYDVGTDNVLSIDPLTGTAQISHRIHPAPREKVQDVAAQHDMRAGDLWEVHYGDAIVAQGVVLQVDTKMSTDGPYWIRQTKYTLGGSASRMLATEASWTALPEEGALTRLQRFFRVDTSLLTSDQRAYLDTVLAEVEAEPGTATLLDLARTFSEHTRFPVRTANNLAGESSARDLIVVPAVVFHGADPPTLYVPPASTWTLDAEFLSEQGQAGEKVQTVDVITNFDMFISGVRKQALVAAQVGLTFVLGSSSIGTGGMLSVDVGVRAPVAIDLFGTKKVISRINHQFTSGHYRSSLDLTVPAVV